MQTADSDLKSIEMIHYRVSEPRGVEIASFSSFQNTKMTISHGVKTKGENRAGVSQSSMDPTMTTKKKTAMISPTDNLLPSMSWCQSPADIRKTDSLIVELKFPLRKVCERVRTKKGTELLRRKFVRNNSIRPHKRGFSFSYN